MILKGHQYVCMLLYLQAISKYHRNSAENTIHIALLQKSISWLFYKCLWEVLWIYHGHKTKDMKVDANTKTNVWSIYYNQYI